MRRTSSPEYFDNLTEQEFMLEYVWTAYAAGFRNAVLEAKFPALEKAFHHFNIREISEMTSTAPVLAVINHAKKAEAIVEGARLVSKVGFSNFKEELKREGSDALMHLPYIGPVNKNQLARNIGLKSLQKNDVWIQRLVKLSRSRNDAEMVNGLSQRFNNEPGVADLILWRFCANTGWKIHGYSSLDEFYRSL